MKCLFPLLMFLVFPLFADSAFDQGRAFYDQNKFTEALESYQSIEGHSAALDYNIGNTLMRLGRPQEAIAYYRRAQWQNAGDADTRANLDRALADTGAVVPPLPLPRRLTGFLDPGQWQFGFMLSCWVIAGIGLAGLRISSLRNLYGWIFPLAALWMLLFGIGVWASRPSAYFHEGVVKEQNVTARFEPLADSTEHFSLPGGSVVSILDQSRDWYKVSAEEKEGWIQASQLLSLQEI